MNSDTPTPAKVPASTDSRTVRLRELFRDARAIAQELHAEADETTAFDLTTIQNYCTRAITRVGHVEKGWRK
ncbi:MAG: hypothetical protein WDA07_14280 [Leucobacter sp.]